MTDNETPGGEPCGEAGSPSGLGAVLGMPADVGTVVTSADNVTTRTAHERHELERLCALLGAGFDLTTALALSDAGYDVLGYYPLPSSRLVGDQQ